MHDEQKDKLKHELTLKGQADDVGIIPTNSANPEASLTLEEKQQRKAKEERLQELIIWLAEYQTDLEEQLAMLELKLDAGHKLINAFKNGERDFSSAEYQSYLAITEWEIEDFESGKALEDLKHWEIKAKVLNDKLNKLDDKDQSNIQELENLYIENEFNEDELAILNEGFGDFDKPTESIIDVGFELKEDFQKAVSEDNNTIDQQPSSTPHGLVSNLVVSP